MSIIKIPCILVATIALNKSLKAPNYASKGEAIPIVSTLDWFMNLSRIYARFIRGVFWVQGIAEVAAIMTNHWPSLPLSRYVLSITMPHGISSNLCLTPMSVAGMLLIAFGTIVRIYCYRKLKSLFTFEVSIRDNHKLITTGLYSIVRHPSYSGLVLVYIGGALWYGSRGSWLRESGVMHSIAGSVFIYVYTAILLINLAGMFERIPRENAALRRTFGKEWEEWARRVPYSLIPGVY